MLNFNSFYNHLTLTQGNVKVSNLRYFLDSVEIAFDYTDKGYEFSLNSLEFFTRENVREIHELQHIIRAFRRQLNLATVIDEIKFELNNIIVIMNRDTIRFEGYSDSSYNYSWESEYIDLERITNLYIYSHAESWG